MAQQAPPQSTALQSFVARQPIFNRPLRVYAYELLFRSSWANAFPQQDVDVASAKMIAESSMLHDLGRLTSGKRAFINVTREVLLQDYVRAIPPTVAVVELLESIEPDEEVLARCRELRDAGYMLAVDDVIDAERLEPFLDLVQVVKLDLLDATPPAREAIAQRTRYAGLRLLAEKVENRQMLEEAQDLGCSLFQGYFFSRPVVVAAGDVSANKQALLEILRELHRPDLDFDELEKVVKRDMALCYKLLRYVNAAHMGLRYRIDSVRRALVLLGTQNIRRWASLVVLTMMGEDRPHELIQQALVRARFCEHLAPAFRLEGRAEDLFLLGMFSLIDAVLGRPMPELIEPLHLADDVKATLVGSSSDLVSVFDFTRAYERGAWDAIGDTLPVALQEAEVTKVYIEALDWAGWCSRIGTAG